MKMITTSLPARCRTSDFGLRNSSLLILGLLLVGLPTFAFPPAPNHTFYGLVRDEMGDPIVVTNAVVILETLTGIQIQSRVIPYLAPGLNYRLAVPMDAGLTADNYKPTALRPTVSFRMKVKIGTTVYLPLELRGGYANLGRPAQRTHLDLTLGEDTDGDGLPDAWERALIDMLGGGLTFADIRPGDDSDGDGLTNLQEYIAGTYAFDAQDGLRLDAAGLDAGHPLLDFMVIRGRSYTILASADLQTWIPVDFRLAGSDPNAASMSSYAATDVRILRAEVVQPPGQPTPLRAFKLMAQ
jgi:hypothetical protein